MTNPTIYRIETPRLVIRCWEPADAPRMKATTDANVDHLKTFLPWAVEYPKPLSEVVDWLRSVRARFDRGEDFVYGIFDRAETRVLGGTGLHPRVGLHAREIGYWMDGGSTRQGYATEAAAALTRVGFELLNLERVEIHCAVENAASAAIPKKLGYTLDAVLRHRMLLLNGQYHDTMIWSILREEYHSSPSAGMTLQAYDAIGQEIK